MSQASAEPEPARRARIIDEFAAIRQQMMAWKPAVNPHAERFAELQQEILSWFEGDPAEKKIIAEGNLYTLPISPRQNKRTVFNIVGFLRKIGAKRYAVLVPPPLNVVEREIPKERLHLYISEERSGRRTIGEPVLRDAA